MLDNKKQGTEKLGEMLFVGTPLLLLICSAVTYGWQLHTNIIRADQWRFIKRFLYPVYENTFSLSVLWSDFHPNPLAAAIFILGEKYNDLTRNLYFDVGMTAKVILVLFLARLMWLSTPSNNKWLKISGILLVCSTFLSLKSFSEYHWPLVTLSNIWLLYMLIFYVVVERTLKNSDIQGIAATACMSGFYLTCARDGASIAMASVISLLALSALVHKELRKSAIKLFFALVAGFIIFKLSYYVIGAMPASKGKPPFDIALFDLIAIFTSYSIALTSGLFDFGMLRVWGFSNNGIMYLSYVVLTIYLFVLLAYTLKCAKNRTTVPLYVMGFVLFYITAVICFRYFPVAGKVNWWVAAPRYLKIYELGIGAMIWAIIILLQVMDVKKAIQYACTGMFVLIFAVNVLSVKGAWARLAGHKERNLRIEQLLLQYQPGDKDKLPKDLRGGFFSESKVDFLKKNKLNVYSEKYFK